VDQQSSPQPFFHVLLSSGATKQLHVSRLSPKYVLLEREILSVDAKLLKNRYLTASPVESLITIPKMTPDGACNASSRVKASRHYRTGMEAAAQDTEVYSSSMHSSPPSELPKAHERCMHPSYHTLLARHVFHTATMP
jgi:hypothetical protein